MLSSLLSCFTGATDSHYDSACAFCDVSTDKGFNIVWEDDIFVGFLDRSPAAEHHILIVPKTHIPSVRDLRKDDASMVKSMEAIGHKLLDSRSVPIHRRRMGFHIPPFNSVQHIHLHVHGLPYVSPAKEAKYPIAKGFGKYNKGLSWFAEVQQTIKILESNRSVGILPC